MTRPCRTYEAPNVLTAGQYSAMVEGLAKVGLVVTRRGRIMAIPKKPDDER